MNQRQILMGVGLAVAAWFAFVADKTPADASAGEPVAAVAPAAPPPPTPAPSEATDATNTPATPRSRAGEGSAAPIAILRLRERPPYVARQEGEPRAFALFGNTSWDPPPPKLVAGPPPAPVAPPLPYSYLGKKFEAGHWEVYLALGDDARVARVHGRLDEKYRIDSITPPTLSLTYLPLMQVQTLNIGSTE